MYFMYILGLFCEQYRRKCLFVFFWMFQSLSYFSDKYVKLYEMRKMNRVISFQILSEINDNPENLEWFICRIRRFSKIRLNAQSKTFSMFAKLAKFYNDNDTLLVVYLQTGDFPQKAKRCSSTLTCTSQL